MGGLGGFGGAGGAFGTAPLPSVETPLGLEPALPSLAATRGTAKTITRFHHDKRTPIRGSLMAKGAGKTIFVPHTAKNAVPVGNGSEFVVAAATGLWLHDSVSLAKRSRLVASPVLDVAASPNGSRIAYVFADGRLRIISYPELSTIVSIKVDVPKRMRFSTDGQRLALGSESDTVTLVQVASGAVPKVIDTEEDVNDAYPMPDKPDEVAYASDEDEIVIVDVATSSRAFGSEQLVMSWRQSNKPFFVMRDQNAVAFDSLTGTLLGGGDDNMIWRIADVRKSPRLESPTEVDGNVVDIACCAGTSAADRAAFVAIDNGQVRTIGMNGRLGPTFGSSGSSPLSHPIRISLMPSGDVLVVPQPGVVRWEPRTGAILQSNDYAFTLSMSSVIDADTVYVPCDGGSCVVHRVAHGAAPVADVETTMVGDVQAFGVRSILEYAGGLRAIVVAQGGKLRLAYLPVGGSLEQAIDTEVPSEGIFNKRDGSTHGYVDSSGKVYEIVANPRGMRQVGMALGKGAVTGLEWEASKTKWRVRRMGEDDVFVP